MANIQTEISKIDSRKHAEQRGFLLPYQLAWVFDDSRLKLAEKSVRIGWTFAQEFSVVRGRLATTTDYLHGSVTQGVAQQFIRECGFWLDQYKIKGTSIGEIDYVNELENIAARAQYIQFPNKSRIIAFSSSPNAMRGYGGEVGLDEIAFHRFMAAMLKSAGGRAMWGDPVSMWSSHCGVDSEFNQFILREQANPKSKWSRHKVTIVDAIDQGLLDTINRTRGTNFTREAFLEDCRAMVGSDDAYEEEFMCNPRESGTPAVSWYDIRAAEEDYYIFSCQITGNAGQWDPIDPSISELLDDNPFLQLDRSKRYSLGYDIARTGHLSSVMLLETAGKEHRIAMHILMHQCKFPSQQKVIELAFQTLPYLSGSGDKTGLGMATCEALEDLFPFRFFGVNFSAFKPYLGSRLAAAFADRRIKTPKAYGEIGYDVHSIATKQTGTRMSYTERKNPANSLSHGDMAWALALAITNAEDGADGIGLMEGAGEELPEYYGGGSSWEASRYPDHSDDT